MGFKHVINNCISFSEEENTKVDIYGACACPFSHLYYHKHCTRTLKAKGMFYYLRWSCCTEPSLTSCSVVTADVYADNNRMQCMKIVVDLIPQVYIFVEYQSQSLERKWNKCYSCLFLNWSQDCTVYIGTCKLKNRLFVTF